MTRVAEALGQLGDPRAVPALRASVDRVRDPDYRRAARKVLEDLEATR